MLYLTGSFDQVTVLNNFYARFVLSEWAVGAAGRSWVGPVVRRVSSQPSTAEPRISAVPAAGDSDLTNVTFVLS